jgi:hypothetical protein
MIEGLQGRADTSDGKSGFGLACAYARAGYTDRILGRMRQRSNPGGGGRGFNSSRRGRPFTAPGLTPGFFLVPKTFDFFSRNQRFKRQSGRFLQIFQRAAALPSSAYGHLFSVPAQYAGFRKLSRNSPGGGRGQPRKLRGQYESDRVSDRTAGE